MADITTAFWGMVINNYDATDLALVQQGYPDFVRKIVYTLEKGESGTPHIQAFIRLYRQQRLSYMKKLFPRGNFKALVSDEYRLNAERYAQKLDGTAESAAVIINNPFPDPIVELTDVMRAVLMKYEQPARMFSDTEMMKCISQEEKARVSEKPNLAKFYVSATYKAVKKQFWRSIGSFLEKEADLEKSDTHTHTHTQRKVIFSTGSITSDGEDSEGGYDSTESGEEYEEDEDHEDSGSEASEGYDEGGSSQCSEEDACSDS